MNNECPGVSYTKVHNEEPVKAIQRNILERLIREGIIYGSVKGIDYLTKQEAAVLINDVYNQRRK